MEPIQSLETLRKLYDERGTKGLKETAVRIPTPAWVEALIDGLPERAHCVPATWLIRAYLQQGLGLSSGQTARWIRSLSKLDDDDARLHACQSVVHLDVPKRNAEQLARFLRTGAEGQHKFTRAWAVDGFHRLALQHAQYAEEAGQRLDRALRDPAASVRARARHIAKERRF